MTKSPDAAAPELLISASFIHALMAASTSTTSATSAPPLPLADDVAPERFLQILKVVDTEHRLEWLRTLTNSVNAPFAFRTLAVLCDEEQIDSLLRFAERFDALIATAPLYLNFHSQTRQRIEDGIRAGVATPSSSLPEPGKLPAPDSAAEEAWRVAPPAAKSLSHLGKTTAIERARSAGEGKGYEEKRVRRGGGPMPNKECMVTDESL